MSYLTLRKFLWTQDKILCPHCNKDISNHKRVCDNGCGTVKCYRCDKGWYYSDNYIQIHLGHSENCGKSSLSNPSDDE